MPETDTDLRLKIAKEFVDEYEELRKLFSTTQRVALGAIAYAIKEKLAPISHEEAGGRSNKEIIMSYVYSSEEYAKEFLRSAAWALRGFDDTTLMPDYSEYHLLLESYLNAGVKELGGKMMREAEPHDWYHNYLLDSFGDE